MARQKGIIKLEGTIGDITFVKTRDGYIAKERTSMNRSRIASDPAFQRTRENNAEFGRAGKAGKMLRTAFRGQLQKVSDSRMVSRLTKEMMRVIQADATSDRGERNVLDGEAELLEAFDFNINGKLGTTLFAPYTAAINRTTGAMTVEIPVFIPINMIAPPADVPTSKSLLRVLKWTLPMAVMLPIVMKRRYCHGTPRQLPPLHLRRTSLLPVQNRCSLLWV